ncbi:hypothetical protein VQ042_16880 [Aurantimonas sp. A2-1-M11]|uniref:hypothetical protein n=1 Tax=Aurantimonas sp. A2-1-M11 TaxID=3113712 RepID=UPI002F9236AB
MLRSLLIAAFLGLSLGPVGPAQPLMVRTVTIGPVTGAAYYSVIEQGYRFVGDTAVQVAAEEPAMTVSALEPAAPTDEPAAATAAEQK